MTLKRKAAFVDLGIQAIEIKEIPQRLIEMYLGGRGIDMYLLHNLLAPGMDPLDPENVFLVSAGLLTGAPVPSAHRLHVGGKSPLTGYAGSFSIGGFFGPELRFAGFDHLVIRGKAEIPVYLWVHNGEIEIRDASPIWGKDTLDTTLLLREDLGDEDVRVMTIGSDGENLEKMADVQTSIRQSDGSAGMGTLMGSKCLKAVAVRGTLPINIADPENALRYLEELIDFTHSSDETKNYFSDEVLQGIFDQKGISGKDHRKAWLSCRQDCIYSLADALGLAKLPTVFLSPNDNPIPQAYSLLLEAITGLHYTFEELIAVGERIYNIERLFNIREGVTRENDTLLEHVFPDSKLAAPQLRVIDLKKFEHLLDVCYEIHGWDREGNPKPQTLKRLGLDQEPSHIL
jgi:aldehyde:ferredoxin oxidoreductase